MRDKEYYKAYRNKLPKSYIIDTLKKQGFTKDKITQDVIEEKRLKLKDFRSGIRKTVKPKIGKKTKGRPSLFGEKSVMIRVPESKAVYFKELLNSLIN